jgi:hypothetical protein
MVSVATIIGVGFLATWAMVSNVTASLFLAIWRPFRLGVAGAGIARQDRRILYHAHKPFGVAAGESGAGRL